MEYFDETPSTSHSSPRHEDVESEGRRTDLDSSAEQSSCGSAKHSKIQDISIRARDMLEKINNCRANDQKVMARFEETLVEKVTEFSQQMKEQMFSVYEDNSHDMQAMLQELSEILERCSKLHADLLEACEALESLREVVALSPTPQE